MEQVCRTFEHVRDPLCVRRRIGCMNGFEKMKRGLKTRTKRDIPSGEDATIPPSLEGEKS